MSQHLKKPWRSKISYAHKQSPFQTSQTTFWTFQIPAKHYFFPPSYQAEAKAVGWVCKDKSVFRRESRRWLKPAGCFPSPVESLCQHELVQKAKLKTLIKNITVPATVITSSLGSPKILFSVSNTMNTELGASSRTKTCRKTWEVRSSQSLGIQVRETLVFCPGLRKVPWKKRYFQNHPAVHSIHFMAENSSWWHLISS